MPGYHIYMFTNNRKFIENLFWVRLIETTTEKHRKQDCDQKANLQESEFSV